MILAVSISAFYWIIIILLVVVVFYLLMDKQRRNLRTDSQEFGSGVPEIGFSLLEAKQGETSIQTEEVDELKEKLAAFNQAMAQCPSSIIIADLEGNIQYVNARFTEISGYTLEDVIGRNPRFLKSGNMDPEVYADLWKTISGGSVWRGELENRSKSGQMYWELVSISPIKDSEGNLLRYFSVKEDITEMKLQEDEAKRSRLEVAVAEASDQAKSVFLKVIGEEMKNPLNQILGFTNLLSQSQLNNDQLKHLNQVGGAGLKLLALIDRILDFTKAETGTMELENQPFKPAEVLDNLLKIYEQKAAARNIVVKREISESIPDHVVGDEKRFRQVLEHLLDNAVQYTFEGTIRVSLSATYNKATQIWEFRGEVEDTGKGFPEEKIQELFKPFTHLEPGSGVGLGLALCQRLCHLQGGVLNAKSIDGEGTTFTFDLKLKPMDVNQMAVQVAQGPEGKLFARSYPVDILVAEDNRINRRLLDTLMERLGYEAAFAVDGVGVLSEIRKQSYDLILMDLQMPNMNGIEAARRIRTGEVGKDVAVARIVAITAFTSDENIQASHEVGMDAFLAKPFDISKIKMEIIRAYESKMARRSKVS
ncbi:MAG: PAS domain S-box protein [Verrucomicrobia bacterium]|nr:PAS domain S-box protein [Verrucomicrobiota bacterium]